MSAAQNTTKTFHCSSPDCEVVFEGAASGTSRRFCPDCKRRRRRNQRTAWIERNPEGHREAQAKYRADNREACASRTAAWLEQNLARKLETQRAWRERNPEAVLRHNRESRRRTYSRSNKRFSHIKSNYGLTQERVLEMLDGQDWACPICHKQFITIHDFHVDHCHTTGKVRGLLCGKCNPGLGYFSDDVGRLLRAIKYLDNS